MASEHYYSVTSDAECREFQPSRTVSRSNVFTTITIYAIVEITGKKTRTRAHIRKLNAATVNPSIPPLFKDCQSQLPATKWKPARRMRSNSRLKELTEPPMTLLTYGRELKKDRLMALANSEAVSSRRKMPRQRPSIPTVKNMTELIVVAMVRCMGFETGFNSAKASGDFSWGPMYSGKEATSCEAVFWLSKAG